MHVPLVEAAAATCGGKAGALGVLLRAGLPVPDGFVLPFDVHRAAVGDSAPHVGRDAPEIAGEAVEKRPLPLPVMAALEQALEGLGARHVAVRSSAADEDTGEASAAGQYESVLAVHGAAAVADAVRACWASLSSPRALAYRSGAGGNGDGPDQLAMAVLVQRHLDAEVSGVLFTPANRGDPTVLESAWGLGTSVVAGTVTPDTYRVRADGTVTCTVAEKRTRVDRVGSRLLARDVPVERRGRPTLDDATARALATLGAEVAATLGRPQDIEWAVAEGNLWLLQSRPITAAPPSAPPSSGTSPSSATLTGTPGSHGTATGTARTVRGPRDFAGVRPGDILICPFTDPAWTPLLRMVAGVVTETGGALSHAAIVAREHGIPAVLGVPDAVDTVPDGVAVTIDGTTGTVTTAHV